MVEGYDLYAELAAAQASSGAASQPLDDQFLQLGLAALSHPAKEKTRRRGRGGPLTAGPGGQSHSEADGADGGRALLPSQDASLMPSSPGGPGAPDSGLTLAAPSAQAPEPAGPGSPRSCSPWNANHPANHPLFDAPLFPPGAAADSLVLPSSAAQLGSPSGSFLEREPTFRAMDEEDEQPTPDLLPTPDPTSAPATDPAAGPSIDSQPPPHVDGEGTWPGRDSCSLPSPSLHHPDSPLSSRPVSSSYLGIDSPALTLPRSGQSPEGPAPPQASSPLPSSNSGFLSPMPLNHLFSKVLGGAPGPHKKGNLRSAATAATATTAIRPLALLPPVPQEADEDAALELQELRNMWASRPYSMAEAGGGGGDTDLEASLAFQTMLAQAAEVGGECRVRCGVWGGGVCVCVCGGGGDMGGDAGKVCVCVGGGGEGI